MSLLVLTRRSPTYNDMAETDPPSRRFLPQPVETTTKSHRRFPAEPVETITRTARSKDEEKQSDPSPPPDPPKRRFVPQLVETSVKSNRVSEVKPTPELTPEPSPRSPPPELAHKSTMPRRRYTPQLIETTKRSKKAGDPRPATLPTDKTDITPGTNHIYMPRQRTLPLEAQLTPYVPANTPSTSLPYMPYLPTMPPNPPRRQGSMKPHLNTRRSTRQNSFQPELDSILSDNNSDEAMDEAGPVGIDTPALTASFGSSEESVMKLQMARTRESCDDRFSGYLLELAAKAAEKQLREQAEAAFPNSDYHDPVEHFYDREIDTSSEEDEDTIGVGLLPHEMLGDMHPVRRKSTEVGWEAREMQQHQEHLARLREEETHRLLAAEASQPTFPDPFWTNGMTVKNGPVADKEKEAELERMRNAASPPMLGGDLVFRRCPSPKATKFETDQRTNVMPKRNEEGGGLWGGYCVADDESQYISPVVRGPPLLETPANEREDVFSVTFGIETNGKKSRPSSPTASKGGVHLLTGLDERLRAEADKSKAKEALELEFDDKFVTQVYNYLSLGYPSLARQYDEELSKISRIPEEALNKDDSQADVTGHIGLVEGDTIAASGIRCARWTALRLYILEWARQHPDMNEATSPSAWGVRARRGSWAI